MRSGNHEEMHRHPAESTERSAEESRQASHRKVVRKLGSYRGEIAIELFLIVACMLLGVAFQLKIMMTISLFCIAAAIPDIVTGILVRRSDPDPRHGKALLYFFVASGLLRTATLGVGVFVSCLLAFMLFPFAGGLADVGAVTGLLVTMGVFVVVFPLTLLGVRHGLKLRDGVFFCRELTRLRRHHGEAGIRLDELNPVSSLRILAAGSAISAAVFSMASVFAVIAFLSSGNRPPEWTQLIMVAVVLAQLVIPVAWYIFFCVRFVDPWQTDRTVLGETQDPLRPDEFQVIRESL